MRARRDPDIVFIENVKAAVADAGLALFLRGLTGATALYDLYDPRERPDQALAVVTLGLNCGWVDLLVEEPGRRRDGARNVPLTDDEAVRWALEGFRERLRRVAPEPAAAPGMAR